METILVTQCPRADWTLRAFLSTLVRAAKGQSVTGSDLRMRCCRRLRNRLTGSPRLLKTLPKREESFKGLNVFLILSLTLGMHPSSFFLSQYRYCNSGCLPIPFQILYFPPYLNYIYLTVWRHFYTMWHESREGCGKENWVSSLPSFNECDWKLKQ